MKKKAVKKTKAKKVVKPAAKKQAKPVGAVTHFYGKIKVAIIKFKKPVKVGTEIAVRGATSDFTQAIASMQYDHKPIKLAKKGQEVGIRVKKKAHEGDQVYIV